MLATDPLGYYAIVALGSITAVGIMFFALGTLYLLNKEASKRVL